MSRRAKLPGYALHKPSGQSRIVLDGRQRVSGAGFPPESHERYARRITERSAAGTPSAIPAGVSDSDLTIIELLLK